MPLCRLGLELSRLPSDLLVKRDIDPLRLDKEPRKLARDSWRHGNDPWRLGGGPSGSELIELCKLEREPFSIKGEDWRRSGGSSSWSLYGSEKTGQDAVEEQEPRSCRVPAALALGWRRSVAISSAFPPRVVFGDPFCTDSSLTPSSEMVTHK